MKKISILVLEGCTTISPIGAMEIMNKASVIHQQLTGNNQPFFIIELAGSKNKKSESFRHILYRLPYNDRKDRKNRTGVDTGY
jgi:hypothetical protein